MEAAENNPQKAQGQIPQQGQTSKADQDRAGRRRQLLEKIVAEDASLLKRLGR